MSSGGKLSRVRNYYKYLPNNALSRHYCLVKYPCSLKHFFIFRGKVECKEPLDKVHPKIGTWRVRDGGKQSHTIFERVNCNGTSSVVRCKSMLLDEQYLAHLLILLNEIVWVVILFVSLIMSYVTHLIFIVNLYNTSIIQFLKLLSQ